MFNNDDASAPDLSEGLMKMNDVFLLFTSQAQGYKEAVIRMGWDERNAEAAATELLIGMIRLTFASQTAYLVEGKSPDKGTKNP